MAALDRTPAVRCPTADPMLAQTPGVEAQGRGPGRRQAAEPARLPPSRRRLGRRRRSVGKVMWRAREPLERHARGPEDEPRGQGLRLPGLRVAGRPEGPAPRHLRERHQARHLGDDAQAGRRRVLRRAHRHRAASAGATSRSRIRAASTEPLTLRRRDATRTCRSRGTTRSRSSARRCAASTSPDQASFYTSGRLGNEATFLYQLWVRELGTNNLPDCSNMCHEASGRALTASIGTGKGTVRPGRLGAGRPDLRDRRRTPPRTRRAC